jgi:60 kDa SS-A/Ro ribonucleoprotein
MGTHIMPREAAAAMALITLATEPSTIVTTFSSGSRGNRLFTRRGIEQVTLSSRMRLDDVVRTVNGMYAGGTDCALPMIYAREETLPVDTFVVYTDSETWAGHMHPSQALQQFRQSSGRDARLVVVGMVSNGFTIADPQDPGMLDVVGFDASAPKLISDFSAGRL